MKPKFIMMIGISGSGKSAYAEKLTKEENAVIHSSDNLRVELYGDVNNVDKNNKLFQELHKRIKNDLNNNKNVIYDSCNISHKRRKAFLEELKNIDCTKTCYFIATPYQKCLEQNSKRERKVPEYVIKNMYKNIYIPQYYEGWDEIKIVWNNGSEYKQGQLDELFNKLCDTHQDNPNHTLTIGDHCKKCAENTFNYKDFELWCSALLHDIGKLFTKEFKDSKGNTTEIAHYYNHHLVSAYDALFYLKHFENIDILKVVKYITWHMQPYFMKEEKTKTKFINLVGKDFYDKLMLLNEADMNAK